MNFSFVVRNMKKTFFLFEIQNSKKKKMLTSSHFLMSQKTHEVSPAPNSAKGSTSKTFIRQKNLQ